MPYNIRGVGPYPPSQCGVAEYLRAVATSAENFTGEVNSILVAASFWKGEDVDHSSPVDMEYDQDDENSCIRAASAIVTKAKEKIESGPTVALPQIEFGLGWYNLVTMTKILHDGELIVMPYLHTIPQTPTDMQKKILQDLAEYSDMLIAHTERGKRMLMSPTYGIDESLINVIPHGIRTIDTNKYDRLKMKEKHGFGKRFVISSFGFRDPVKGLGYDARAYALFLKGCSKGQRKNMFFLMGGTCHPKFKARNDGKDYREYEDGLNTVFENEKLKWRRIKHSDELPEVDFNKCDVVLLDEYMPNQVLKELYGATNINVLAYLNPEQAVSGRLADALSGRCAVITTKFDDACEAYGLKDTDNVEKDILGLDKLDAPCVLVDPGEESVEQIARVLDYLIIGKKGKGGKTRRLQIERRGYNYVHNRTWDNSVWQMLQCARDIDTDRRIVTGRGIVFKREVSSPFDDPE